MFKLNLAGAEESTVGVLENGRIQRVPCYVRGERRLPLVGVQANLVNALRQHTAIDRIMQQILSAYAHEPPEHRKVWWHHTLQVLEVMANNYWVSCDFKKGRPVLNVSTPDEGPIMHQDKTWV